MCGPCCVEAALIIHACRQRPSIHVMLGSECASCFRVKKKLTCTRAACHGPFNRQGQYAGRENMSITPGGSKMIARVNALAIGLFRRQTIVSKCKSYAPLELLLGMEMP